jgi:hypothetical protein
MQEPTIFQSVEFRGTAEQLLDLLFMNYNYRRMDPKQLKALIREYGDLRVEESQQSARIDTRDV